MAQNTLLDVFWLSFTMVAVVAAGHCCCHWLLWCCWKNCVPLVMEMRADQINM